MATQTDDKPDSQPEVPNKGLWRAGFPCPASIPNFLTDSLCAAVVANDADSEQPATSKEVDGPVKDGDADTNNDGDGDGDEDGVDEDEDGMEGKLKKKKRTKTISFSTIAHSDGLQYDPIL